MIEYIKKFAADIVDGKANPLRFYLDALKKELDQLHAKDFVAASQYDFMVVRMDVAKWAEWGGAQNPEAAKQVARKLIEVLDGYAGENSQAITRSFAFVPDAGLRSIVERDYKELSLILFPGGAWKSTVIMAGSILEAILFSLLASDPVRNAAAMSSTKAPKSKGTIKLLEGENWKLDDLIRVAADINLIPVNRADTFDQTLRDYRNFVHPNKEVRSGHPCTEAEALMAKGALDGVCNHLEETI